MQAISDSHGNLIDTESLMNIILGSALAIKNVALDRTIFVTFLPKNWPKYRSLLISLLIWKAKHFKTKPDDTVATSTNCRRMSGNEIQMIQKKQDHKFIN